MSIGFIVDIRRARYFYYWKRRSNHIFTAFFVSAKRKFGHTTKLFTFYRLSIWSKFGERLSWRVLLFHTENSGLMSYHKSWNRGTKSSANKRLRISNRILSRIKGLHKICKPKTEIRKFVSAAISPTCCWTIWDKMNEGFRLIPKGPSFDREIRGGRSPAVIWREGSLSKYSDH